MGLTLPREGQQPTLIFNEPGQDSSPQLCPNCLEQPAPSAYKLTGICAVQGHKAQIQAIIPDTQRHNAPFYLFLFKYFLHCLIYYGNYYSKLHRYKVPIFFPLPLDRAHVSHLFETRFPVYIASPNNLFLFICSVLFPLVNKC